VCRRIKQAWVVGQIHKRDARPAQPSPGRTAKVHEEVPAAARGVPEQGARCKAKPSLIPITLIRIRYPTTTLGGVEISAGKSHPGNNGITTSCRCCCSCWRRRFVATTNTLPSVHLSRSTSVSRRRHSSSVPSARRISLCVSPTAGKSVPFRVRPAGDRSRHGCLSARRVGRWRCWWRWRRFRRPSAQPVTTAGSTAATAAAANRQ
jgi:hypothetical protein